VRGAEEAPRGGGEEPRGAEEDPGARQQSARGAEEGTQERRAAIRQERPCPVLDVRSCHVRSFHVRPVLNVATHTSLAKSAQSKNKKLIY